MAAAIVTHMLDVIPGFELAVASVSENYRNFRELGVLYEDPKISEIANCINTLDVVTSHDKKSLLTEAILSALINSFSLEELYQNITTNKQIMEDLATLKEESDKELESILQVIDSENNQTGKLIFYRIPNNTEYGTISVLFKKLRGFLANDSRFTRVIVVLYQHMDNNYTYFRAGEGTYFSESINLGSIFNGSGILEVENFGGGHYDKVGGKSITNIDIPLSGQIARLKRLLKEKPNQPDIKQIGFSVTLAYIRESILDQSRKFGKNIPKIIHMNETRNQEARITSSKPLPLWHELRILRNNI